MNRSFGVSLAELNETEIDQGRLNSPSAANKPYVVMVSLDGFRWDYAERYGAENILRIGKEGVSTKRLIPSFPSKTFPNHYTIATGLFPAKHGIIANEFYSRILKKTFIVGNKETVENPIWWGGTPIWNLVEQHGMLSASMFWVGSEAPVNGQFPNYHFKYNQSLDYEVRVQKVLQWMDLPVEKRPHLVTLYFSLTDSVGHDYGPESDETGDAVRELDMLIGRLKAGLEATGLPITLVVVSDHGMTEVDPPLNIYDYVDIGKNQFVPGPVGMIYTESEDETDRIYEELLKTSDFATYKRGSEPSYYQFSNPDRVGDLILVTKAPKHLGSWKHQKTRYHNSKGNHGFDPYTCEDMGAIFYASGPTLKQNMQVAPFENIHIYPFIARILDLTISESIDGRPEVTDPLFRTDLSN